MSLTDRLSNGGSPAGPSQPVDQFAEAARSAHTYNPGGEGGWDAGSKP